MRVIRVTKYKTDPVLDDLFVFYKYKARIFQNEKEPYPDYAFEFNAEDSDDPNKISLGINNVVYRDPYGNGHWLEPVQFCKDHAEDIWWLLHFANTFYKEDKQ